VRAAMKKFLSALVAVWAILGPRPSEAQKVYRICALLQEEQFVPALEGFKKKMAELGYVEGKNISYQVYNAESDRERLQRFAEKLVQDKPDLIVTSSTTATVPVAKLTQGTDLPVVFLSSGNPLEFVKSYASSGNNLTGISSAALDLTGKRLELLKELAPRVKRLVALTNPKGATYRDNLVAIQAVAKKSGLTVREARASSREELTQVIGSIARKVADAILLQPDAIITKNVDIVVQHSIQEKIPMIPPLIQGVQRGGLATYASDYFALGQQGAMLAQKILKGAKPADLPIEYPAKLYLVINLKTAKAIGLKVPKEILLRADEVIE